MRKNVFKLSILTLAPMPILVYCIYRVSGLINKRSHAVAIEILMAKSAEPVPYHPHRYWTTAGQRIATSSHMRSPSVRQEFRRMPVGWREGSL